MAHSALLLLVGIVGLRLSVIDLQTHRLPDRLTAPLALSAGTVVLGWGTVEGIRSALVASILTGVWWWAMALLPSRPLGMGDVKLQFILGAALGYGGLYWAIFGAAGSFMLGGAYALARMAFNRGSLHAPIAFGPWMVASTLLISLLRESLEII